MVLEVVKVTVTQIFAVTALLFASGCNFYTAGLLYERYDKIPWLNLLTGIFILYCALKSAM
jgi:hypothetical protein